MVKKIQRTVQKARTLHSPLVCAERKITKMLPIVKIKYRSFFTKAFALHSFANTVSCNLYVLFSRNDTIFLRNIYTIQRKSTYVFIKKYVLFLWIVYTFWVKRRYFFQRSSILLYILHCQAFTKIAKNDWKQPKIYSFCTTFLPTEIRLKRER